jgi:spore germination protein YaaH
VRLTHRLIGRSAGAGLTLALATGLLVGGAAPAAATEAPTSRPRVFVSGWLPYWSPTTSVDSVVGHAALFDEASPFWFSATSASEVGVKGSAGDLVRAVRRLKAQGVPVVPAVTSTMDADAFASLLSSPARRAHHVAALARLARDYRVDGLDLDYETVNFGSSAAKNVVRAKYPLLVKELDAALARKGRLLAVTVPARRSDSDPNWWVYDYRALGAAADRLRLMTYDYSWSGGSPGPIAPFGWVSSVVGYAVSRVNPMKVSVGMPVYGRDWFVRTVSGSCPQSAKASLSRTTAGMESFASSRSISPRWDAASASRTFSYQQRYSTGSGTCVAKRRVWYDDARSLQAKLRLVTKYRVRGVSLWALGNETRAYWGKLSTYAADHPVAVPSVTARVPQEVTYGTTRRVRGQVTVQGHPAANAAVRLLRRPLGENRWIPVGTARTDLRGEVTFSVSPKSHMQYRLATVASWSRARAVSQQATARIAYAVAVAAPVAARRDGTSFVLNGRVGPGLAGVRVARQRLVDGHWVTEDRQRLGGDGRFSFTVRARHATTRSFRVVAGPGSLDRGVSPPVTVSFG